MPWHDVTPWAARKRRKQAEAEQQTQRMNMLCNLCRDWMLGELTVDTAIRQAKQVIEGDADRVIRCE